MSGLHWGQFISRDGGQALIFFQKLQIILIAPKIKEPLFQAYDIIWL